MPRGCGRGWRAAALIADFLLSLVLIAPTPRKVLALSNLIGARIAALVVGCSAAAE